MRNTDHVSSKCVKYQIMIWKSIAVILEGYGSHFDFLPYFSTRRLFDIGGNRFPVLTIYKDCLSAVVVKWLGYRTPTAADQGLYLDQF